MKRIEELAETRTVLALGPGLGLDPETVACVRQLVGSLERPLVVDADGLNALVGELELVRARRAPTILTPHPGEAARLLETDTAAINADRIASARRLAVPSGAVVLLKGAGTVVADPAGRVVIVPTGGPSLSSGGTGRCADGHRRGARRRGPRAFRGGGPRGVVARRGGGSAAAGGARLRAARERARRCAAGDGARARGERARAGRTAEDGSARCTGLQLRFPGP